MSNYTFTLAPERADPALVAEYQVRLAKLKPACSRCGRNLAKGELADRVCRDREVCRIRQSGGTVTGFVALRKFARDRAAKRDLAVSA